MANKITNTKYYADIADAIRAKNGSSDTYYPADMAQAIENLPSGGGTVAVPRKDVNFYDYDGTVVASYTASDFAELSEMPPNPTHDGLTAQGWNWSLADAKAYVASYGGLEIGQMYITTSGDTEIDIELHDGILDPVLHAGPCEIDWGDGTTSTATTWTTTQHIYPKEGSYTIKLTPTPTIDALRFSSGILEKANYSNDAEHMPYRGLVKAIRLGNYTNLGTTSTFKNLRNLETITIPKNQNLIKAISEDTFYCCFSLVSVTIPNTVTEIGDYALGDCFSLVSVSIPNGVTSLGKGVLYDDDCLLSVSIPESVTSAGEYLVQACCALRSARMPSRSAFVKANNFKSNYNLQRFSIPEGAESLPTDFLRNCCSLQSLTIPSTVTTVEAGALVGCYGLKELHVLPTTPPTLKSSSSWGSTSTTPAIQIASDCIIYVPAGSLETYKTATNWTTFASQMQEE